MKFRKKQLIVEAEQYTEYGKLVNGMCNSQSCYTSGNNSPHVHTIHNNQIVNIEVGDFIIPEPDGKHFYPCKPDIFEATYEPEDSRLTSTDELSDEQIDEMFSYPSDDLRLIMITTNSRFVAKQIRDHYRPIIAGYNERQAHMMVQYTKLLEENERARELLRELVMRANLVMPATDRDVELFEAGLKLPRDLTLYEKISQRIGLEMGENNFNPPMPMIIPPAPNSDFLAQSKQKES